MAAILPDDLFPGYELVAAAGTVTADSIVIPLSALTGLSSAEADEATGDGREVARQIDLAIHENYAALPTEERPTYMTSTLAIAALSNGDRRLTITRTYTLTAPISELQLVEEPT
jgi:hypothetical protein